MLNKIVIPPRSTRPHSDPVLRFPGDSCLPKSTAKRVAKLVAVIAKAIVLFIDVIKSKKPQISS